MYVPHGRICGIYGLVILFAGKAPKQAIAGYASVLATPPAAKIADQKTVNVNARSTCS
jgi:hypothetical protein